MHDAADDLIPTRASLLARLKDLQDQASWQVFFDSYWKLIHHVGTRSGLSSDEADDLVQETVISVAKHMPSFKYDPAIGSFKKWLLRLTRWRLIDQFRKRDRAIKQSISYTDMRTSGCIGGSLIDLQGEALDALYEAEWKENLVAAATGNVKRRYDPKKYQMFYLYVNKGWSAERVAASFGVRVSQVYLTKHRITQLLIKEVELLKKGKL